MDPFSSVVHISLSPPLFPALPGMQMRWDNKGELGLEQESDIQLPFSAEREKKIYLSVGNSSLTMVWLPSGGEEIFWVGLRDQWWFTSRKSGLTPSLQATLSQIPVDFWLYLYHFFFFFFAPRLLHYVAVLHYFSHSFFLVHSPSHKCTCSHKANIYTVVSVL